MRHGRRFAPVSLAAVASLLACTAGAAEPATLRPGSVVRWPGEELESCAASGEATQPIDGACLFPIDLLHKAGPLELTRKRAGLPITDSW